MPSFSPTRAVQLCIVLAAISLSSSCGILDATDPAEGCGPDGPPLVLNAPTASAALLSPHLDVAFNNGRREFSWSVLVENVCANEHISARWQLIVKVDSVPAGFQLTAGWIPAQLFGDDVIMPPLETVAGFRLYEARDEFGLKQWYEGKPAQVLMFIDISFISKGTEQTDREVLQHFFEGAFIEARHKTYRPSS